MPEPPSLFSNTNKVNHRASVTVPLDYLMLSREQIVDLRYFIDLDAHRCLIKRRDTDMSIRTINDK